jgi:hypothetical protein
LNQKQTLAYPRKKQTLAYPRKNSIWPFGLSRHTSSSTSDDLHFVLFFNGFNSFDFEQQFTPSTQKHNTFNTTPSPKHNTFNTKKHTKKRLKCQNPAMNRLKGPEWTVTNMWWSGPNRQWAPFEGHLENPLDPSDIFRSTNRQTH